MKIILRQDIERNFIVYDEDDNIVGYVTDTKNITKGMGGAELVIELNMNLIKIADVGDRNEQISDS